MAHSDWEAVIGLEIHVQLATSSKIFSAASAGFGERPNTSVDPVTLGMPGVLPVLNREVVELAMRLGLALGCTIDQSSRFARKHYFYPDLPKGYQISQFAAPICQGGEVRCVVDGEVLSFRLNRIHLEEDAGKNVHDQRNDRSLVDFNRAGVPLVEIVSEPDLRSAAHAVAYMKAVHQVVVALGVSDGNMERGNFRCDANVSVRRRGAKAYGTRTEVKNVNSFRFIGRAVTYEIDRQIGLIEAGGEVTQETRGWDDEAGITRSQRSKEEAYDYRYFPDPDLLPVVIDDAWLASVRATLPELPLDRWRRFQDELGLSAYDADVLTQSVERANYFEQVAKGAGDAKLASNWVTGELMAQLNRDGVALGDSPVAADALTELLGLVTAGTISAKMAKTCFQAMYHKGVSAKDWVAANGGQITDPAVIAEHVDTVIAANPGQVVQYLGGKEKLLGFFVGQVMKATRGKANPGQVNTVVRERLAAQKGDS